MGDNNKGGNQNQGKKGNNQGNQDLMKLYKDQANQIKDFNKKEGAEEVLRAITGTTKEQQKERETKEATNAIKFKRERDKRMENAKISNTILDTNQKVVQLTKKYGTEKVNEMLNKGLLKINNSKSNTAAKVGAAASMFKIKTPNILNEKIVSENQIAIIYVGILLRVGVLYLSSRISSNIMSQIYTEKVLLKGEEPPSLNYQLILFLIIDFFLSLVIILIIYLVNTQDSENNLIVNFLKQYILSTLIIFSIVYVISNIMYRKKYFLYKDDGLRAVRALDELTFTIGSFVSFIPFFLLSF